MYIVGILAFLLCFLHDCNDWKFRKKYLNFCFPLGAAFIAVSSIWMCIPLGVGPVHAVWLRIILGILGIAFAWAEVYSLFFSFNTKDAYIEYWDEERRTVNTTRMYALCRHPGVLFFVLLFIILWLCIGMDFPGMVMLCVLNVLLAAFEDLIVFPKVFRGYEEYKETTPFLVPNCKSISHCIGDFRRK
ncbi:MAG: hypothetical protein Q4D99_03530 [Bacillota bacterium]|nr:hypothetical protein [Bacillota bacterium]